MPAAAQPLVPPDFLQRRLARAARRFFSAADAADLFGAPRGERALLDADSLSWRVFKNPVTLFIGGVAAVILELGEPRVRSGVWDHTTFRADPVGRLRRTGWAAMATVYAAHSRAEAMIANVRRMHARIAGATPAGVPYRADDPDLLVWVHATAAYGFAAAHSAFVRALAPEDVSRFYAEGEAAAVLYGAAGAPRSGEEMDDLFARMRHRLEPSEIVFDFLNILRAAPILPAPLRAGQGLLVRAAIDVAPDWLRARLGLGAAWRLRGWERAWVRAAAGLADRLVLTTSPPVLACRRLGLSDDYLYR